MKRAKSDSKPCLRFYLLLVLVLCGAAQCTAQSLDRQVIGTSGDQYVTAAATMDFTIGEPITATLTGQNGIATQGFHQGTISITSVRETLSLSELNVYPNSQQPTVGLTSHFTSSPHPRSLVPNKDSVAADFYLPLMHHGVMAPNCWVVEKTTCAAAPNFYLLAEYLFAKPKNLCAVA